MLIHKNLQSHSTIFTMHFTSSLLANLQIQHSKHQILNFEEHGVTTDVAGMHIQTHEKEKEFFAQGFGFFPFSLRFFSHKKIISKYKRYTPILKPP